MDDHIRESLRLFDGDVVASAAYVHIQASAPRYKPKRSVPPLRSLQALAADTASSRVAKKLSEKISPKERRIFREGAEEAETIILRKGFFNLSPHKFLEFFGQVAYNLSDEARHEFVLSHARYSADKYNFMWHWVKMNWQDFQKVQRKPIFFDRYIRGADIMKDDEGEDDYDGPVYYFENFYWQLCGVGSDSDEPEYSELEWLLYNQEPEFEPGFWSIIDPPVPRPPDWRARIQDAKGYMQARHNMTIMFDALFESSEEVRMNFGLNIIQYGQSWNRLFGDRDRNRSRQWMIAKTMVHLFWETEPTARLMVMAFLATQNEKPQADVYHDVEKDLVPAQPVDYFWRPADWEAKVVAADGTRNSHALPTESVLFSIDFDYHDRATPFRSVTTKYRYFFRPDAVMKEILPELMAAMDWIQTQHPVVDVKFNFSFNIQAAPAVADFASPVGLKRQLRFSALWQWQELLDGNYTPEEAWEFIANQNWGSVIHSGVREEFMALTEEDDVEFVRKAREFLRDERLDELETMKRIVKMDTSRKLVLQTRHKIRVENSEPPIIFINAPVLMNASVIVPTQKIAFKS